MHTAIALLILLAVLAAFVWQRTPRSNETLLSNLFEGIHDQAKTFALDAAVSTRYLLGTLGTDVNHIAVAGAADFPLGVINDEGSIGDSIAVGLLGKGPTKRMSPSGPIAAGAEVYTDAGGQVQALPTAPGTYWNVGVALTAASGAGDDLEVNDRAPVKLVISGGA